MPREPLPAPLAGYLDQLALLLADDLYGLAAGWADPEPLTWGISLTSEDAP